MIPMQMAVYSLSNALIDSQEDFQNAMAYSQPARKFWSVDCEMHYTKKGLLIGNAFVLAQVLITQAVSTINRLGEIYSNLQIEKNKRCLINKSSKLIDGTSITQITFIDAVANYFKHRSEWPDDWPNSNGSGNQKKTINIVSSVGLSSQDLTENMELSLNRLGIMNNKLCDLCTIIEDWREKLAAHIRAEIDG